MRPPRRPVAVLLAIAAMSIGPRAALADDFRPPEFERLERHAYDYDFRNSNGNVYRSSRHFHPTRNVFRSSRHYQRKLEAAPASYPLRTWVRFAETRNGRTFERSFNYAHPPADRYPHHRYRSAYCIGPTIVETSADAPVRHRNAVERPARVAQQKPAVERPQHRRPTQRAVMRTVVMPDGRTRTIIESVPIVEGLASDS